MMRTLHSVPVLFIAANLGAQSTALDFTLDDCSGTSHQLYSELEAGKIVILEFAMVPACSPCIDAGNALQDILDAYEISHPGVVKWYAWGYNNTYTCTMMEEWDTDNGFTPSGTFINGADQVAYYGGMAMPTIVVLAGSDHHVVHIEEGFVVPTPSHILDAVADALTIGMNDAGTFSARTTLFPNPASEMVSLEATCLEAMSLSITIHDAAGRIVRTLPPMNFIAGTHQLPIPIHDLADGSYLLMLGADAGSRSLPFQVFH